MNGRIIESGTSWLRFEICEDDASDLWRGSVKWDGCIDLERTHFCDVADMVEVARVIGELARKHFTPPPAVAA